MSRPFTTRDRLLLWAGSPRRTAVVVAILMLLIANRWLFPPAPQSGPLEAETRYPVARVVDGDTILLQNRTRVRLIGIDTPELARDDQPAEPLAEAAKDWLADRLRGETVRLEFDIERFDQYDRTLAYVYLQDSLINEELIQQGFSRAETRYPFSDRMKRRFRQAERRAREAGYGIWANDRDGLSDR